MRNLEVIITMGGVGSRFRKAGYNVPKYMIEVKGKSLFEWSLMSLKGFEDTVSQYTFIAMSDKSINVKEFIIQQCQKLGLKTYNVILLDFLTDGQATTAYYAKKYWEPRNRILIYNIDTYVEAGEMCASQMRGDGFIPCFKAKGDQWSFVRLNESGKVAEIKEKQRISDYCTIGAYYFSSCTLYETLYLEYYANEKNLTKGEKYVAPLYDYLLKKGGEIYISEIPNEKVHVLGTPEDLKYFMEEQP